MLPDLHYCCFMCIYPFHFPSQFPHYFTFNLNIVFYDISVTTMLCMSSIYLFSYSVTIELTIWCMCSQYGCCVNVSVVNVCIFVHFFQSCELTYCCTSMPATHSRYHMSFFILLVVIQKIKQNRKTFDKLFTMHGISIWNQSNYWSILITNKATLISLSMQ